MRWFQNHPTRVEMYLTALVSSLLVSALSVWVGINVALPAAMQKTFAPMTEKLDAIHTTLDALKPLSVSQEQHVHQGEDWFSKAVKDQLEKKNATTIR